MQDFIQYAQDCSAELVNDESVNDCSCSFDVIQINNISGKTYVYDFCCNKTCFFLQKFVIMLILLIMRNQLFHSKIEILNQGGEVLKDEPVEKKDFRS